MTFCSVRIKCEKISYENQKNYFINLATVSHQTSFVCHQEFSPTSSRSLKLSLLGQDIPLQVVHIAVQQVQRERQMHRAVDLFQDENLIIFKRFSSPSGLLIEIGNNKSICSIQPTHLATSLFSLSAVELGDRRVIFEVWHHQMWIQTLQGTKLSD